MTENFFVILKVTEDEFNDTYEEINLILYTTYENAKLYVFSKNFKQSSKDTYIRYLLYELLSDKFLSFIFETNLYDDISYLEQEKIYLDFIKNFCIQNTRINKFLIFRSYDCVKIEHGSHFMFDNTKWKHTARYINLYKMYDKINNNLINYMTNNNYNYCVMPIYKCIRI